ncbi:MAG: DUF4258 domain-containing protein [bacterium]|nr:DUF4258 domain-containing protein [bacterium]
MDKNYGGVIWTNHALQRLKERNIKQGDAWATWRNPDQSRFASAQGAWIYYKTYGNERMEIVAKQNERREWLILSVWDRKVYGESIVKPKSSFWKNLKKILFGS